MKIEVQTLNVQYQRMKIRAQSMNVEYQRVKIQASLMNVEYQSAKTDGTKPYIKFLKSRLNPHKNLTVLDNYRYGATEVSSFPQGGQAVLRTQRKPSC